MANTQEVKRFENLWKEKAGKYRGYQCEEDREKIVRFFLDRAYKEFDKALETAPRYGSDWRYEERCVTIGFHKRAAAYDVVGFIRVDGYSLPVWMWSCDAPEGFKIHKISDQLAIFESSTGRKTMVMYSELTFKVER